MIKYIKSIVPMGENNEKNNYLYVVFIHGHAGIQC